MARIKQTYRQRNPSYINDDDYIPSYIIKDDPKPAIFIVRKLFCDFMQLADKKIDSILITKEEIKNQNKSIFKTLNKGEDPIYDRILEAIGAVSEFCLPSLLTLLIAWYHHQLEVDENIEKRQSSCQQPTTPLIIDTSTNAISLNTTTVITTAPLSLQTASTTPTANNSSLSNVTQQPIINPFADQSTAQQVDFLSANIDTLKSNSSTVRSPTPSSPETTSNQISITSTLPLEYQSPSSTIVSSGEHHTSSAANTSTSTATNVSSNSLTEQETTTNIIQRSELYKTRKLLIEYTFCQALIEIFNQLHLHPGHEDLISKIEDIAFDHFKYVEGDTNNSSSYDSNHRNQLADKFAEVIGVLAQTRFKSVKKRFMTDLNDLKVKEPTPYNIQCIVTLLSGMKFFRVKMAPIEEFEASFQFLQECAEYFLEVRHKSIRHALASLFVEIMVPLAPIVKNEVKIPCLKNFVDILWAQTLDMCARKKHSITLFPLVTCLLCLSQRSFFLTNWGVFLNMCLSNLKNRDQKMCRVALDSLYRLIWIYMIRVKCESNNVTQARLHSIVDALFPRGSRSLVPRDAPLNVFVDIIHFIAQERLDFAIRHIIYDLLSVDRSFKVILAPERMNIALQAFLVIADSLQQKDGEPTIPNYIGLSNETTSSNRNACSRRQKNASNHNRMLNNEIAKSIGIYPYYTHIQKSFNDILKALDTQFGKPLLLTTMQNINKEPDDVITSDIKPKIDLFKTCIYAIPRLMPEGMSKMDLIDLLSRMTVHVDEEMRNFSFESLRTLIMDFSEWRLDAIEGFTSFLVNQIDDSLRHLVDNALKMLLQLLLSWKNSITLDSNLANGNELCRAGSVVSIHTGYETISSRHSGTGGQIAARKNRALAEMRLIQNELNSTRFDRLISVIQKVEAAALVMLCNCNQPTRKIATHLLRESRNILKSYSSWVCMEQFGFKSPDDVEEDDLSASLRGSLSADNLSRITTTSANGPLHSSVTSMNTQANLLTSSVSKMCISTSMVGCSLNNTSSHHHFNHNQLHQQQQLHQHDPYDSDLENNVGDCFNNEQSSCIIFCLTVIMLESENEQEYLLALRILKKILPNLPFEQQQFVDEIEKNLINMNWEHFPGLHSLIIKGCTSAATFEISISLLDQLTPILKLPICNGCLMYKSTRSSCTSIDNNNSSMTENSNGNNTFPFHVIILLTYLLANYDDPSSFCLNIARRIAIWCDENGGQKLENLSTVMNLYSRRSFSKNAFQWTKCVVKYLYDAYPKILPQIIPMLIDLLENGPSQIQKLIAPILYCILNYVDISVQIEPIDMYTDLHRLYTKFLHSNPNSNCCDVQWKDAVQIFKLIISRSSYLVTNKTNIIGRAELPGRTMDFTLDIESIPVIAHSRGRKTLK